MKAANSKNDGRRSWMAVNLSSYRLGQWYCKADNVSPGASLRRHGSNSSGGRGKGSPPRQSITDSYETTRHFCARRLGRQRSL